MQQAAEGAQQKTDDTVRCAPRRVFDQLLEALALRPAARGTWTCQRRSRATTNYFFTFRTELNILSVL